MYSGSFNTLDKELVLPHLTSTNVYENRFSKPTVILNVLQQDWIVNYYPLYLIERVTSQI